MENNFYHKFQEETANNLLLNILLIHTMLFKQLLTDYQSIFSQSYKKSASTLTVILYMLKL